MGLRLGLKDGDNVSTFVGDDVVGIIVGNEWVGDEIGFKVGA